MKIQQIEDLKRDVKARIEQVKVQPLGDEFKGAAKAKEKTRREGYVQALEDVLLVANKHSN